MFVRPMGAVRHANSMQREIKFRCWDGNRMVLVGVLDLGTDTAWETYDWYDQEGTGRTNFGVNEVGKLMQFTGLKDKNGKEIYEGDVVKIHNLRITWKRNEPEFDWRVVGIKWNHYLWQFNNSVLSQPLSDYDTRTLEPFSIEIIGNIYENPDLLKQPL